MVSLEIQRAQEQISATQSEIEKGEAEFVKARAETLKFRREAERLPVRVKIPKRELLAGGLKERRVRRIELLGRKRFKKETLGAVTKREQAITKEQLLFQEQVAPARAQIGVVGAQIKEAHEWGLASKYVKKDRFPFFESRSVQHKWATLQPSKKEPTITFQPIPEIIPPSKRIPSGTKFLQPDKLKKSFWGTVQKILPVKSFTFPPSPFGIFFRGKTFSPPALTSHVAGMAVPIVSGSPSSLLPQEAHTVPHLESAGTQPIFTVGNTRNPRTWMNKDTLKKLRQRTRQRVKTYTKSGLSPIGQVVIQKLREKIKKITRPPSERIIAPVMETERRRLQAGKFYELPLPKKILGLTGLGREEMRKIQERSQLAQVRPTMSLERVKRELPFAYTETTMKRATTQQEQILGAQGVIVSRELSKQLQAGKITEAQAEVQFEKIMKPKYEKAQIKIATVTEKADIEIGKRREVGLLPTTYATGAVLTGVAGFLGAGVPVGIFYGGYAITRPKEEYAKMWERKGEVAIGVAGFGLGGMAGTGILKAGKVQPILKTKIYPLAKPKPVMRVRPPEIRKPLGAGLAKSLYRVEIKYPAWRGVVERPLTRAIRLSPYGKIPIIKKMVRAPKIVTLKPPVTYKLWTPKAVTTYKGKIIGAPEVRFQRVGAKYYVKGKLTGEMFKEEALKYPITPKLRVKLKKVSFLPEKPAQYSVGQSAFEKLYRVKTERLTPYFKYVKGKRGIVKVKTEAVMVTKAVEAKGSPELTFWETGYKVLGEKAGMRVGKVPVLRGVTYELPKGVRYFRVVKRKPTELGILATRVKPVKLKIPLWQRAFPKYMPKKAQLALTQITRPKQIPIEVKIPVSIPPRTLYVPPRITPTLPIEAKIPVSIPRPTLYVPPRITPTLPLLAPAISALPVPKYITPLATGVATVPILRLPTLTKLTIGLVQKPALKLELKPVLKPVVKPALRPALRPAIKFITRQVQKPVLKLVLRPVVKPITKLVTRPTTIFQPPVTPPISPFIFPTARIRPKVRERRAVAVKGFRIFVKRKGKRVFLSGVFPRGEAVRIGARQARRTLRATFGIVEAGAIPRRRRAPAFIPSPRIFRTYQIIKGKRVPLKDIWIQKAPYRLSAIGEVREIQVARKTKRRKGGRRVRWL